MNVYIKSGDITDMQGPCPSGFHIPTKDEFDGLISIMSGLSITTGINYRNYLHMPFAGKRNYTNTEVYSRNTYCWYFTSSYGGVSSQYRFSMYGSGTPETNLSSFTDAFPIRGFKDSYVTPDNTWTVITGTLGSGGIFWNESDGIISITGDGSTGYTIADKNVGATKVYSDGDTYTDANMGYMYQRGNNYGFPATGTISNTSTSQVDASSYGPGNYYNSSTFIIRKDSPYGWDSSKNKNLRGGETGPVSMSEVKNIYIGEYVPPYLCFTANTAGSTVQLTKTGSPTSVTLETSTDLNTWTTYTFGTTITLANIGDKVYWRNTSTTDTGFNLSNSAYYKFVMTGSIAASGDVNFLLNKNSTTTASSYCYNRLFYQCTSLTTTPELPATTLSNACYNYMFYGCTGLTSSPALPATTLADYCYSSMFYGCTGLTNTPTLPATTLTSGCYANMFNGCTSLTTLPSLPATTLPDACYQGMFRNCSKIKLSTTQTGTYQTAYRIPTTGTGTVGNSSLDYMFGSTGGTFTGTPSINTTYYTSNTVV